MSRYGLSCVLVLFLMKLTRCDWVETWGDDFNGAGGSSPDGKWNFDLGDGSPNTGWGNKELQYYTESTENAVLDGNGNLNIIARKDGASRHNCYYGPCQYTSARLKTKGNFAQTYGKFEARIKVPAGAGLWPAFWLLGDNIDSVSWPRCGEIDIMEIRGSNPGTVSGTIHGPGYEGGRISTKFTLDNGATFAQDFHVFTLEWSPDKFTWFVDHNPFRTVTSADLPAGTPWVFDHPFFILINLAVGGYFDGNPAHDLHFPQHLTVDYVKVYKWV